MAFVRMKSGQSKFVCPEQGNAIWLVMNGERVGTPRQRNFARRVDRLYLNRSTAPKSYCEQYPDPGERKPEPVGQIRLPYID